MSADWWTPAADDPPDIDFRETLDGGHALVLEYCTGHALMVEYGDESFSFTCQCGNRLAPHMRPDRPWADILRSWVEHAEAGARVVMAHCQCSVPFGTSSFAHELTERWSEAIVRIWEHHTMTELEATP